MELKMTIETWAKESRYIAKCPELDFVSQGESPEEAKRNLLEVVEIQFEEMTDMGTLDEYLQECGYTFENGLAIPTNENTNGLLRQYFPKGTDFGKVTEEDLAFAVKKLNHRPRKCLGYQSPHEVFWKTPNGALAT